VLPANNAFWTIVGKSPIKVFLKLNRRLLGTLPRSLSNLGPVRSYGILVHRLAQRYGIRSQAPSTFFLRNRSQLELIRRLIEQRVEADTLRVAVLGCSIGTEAYSIAWRVRSARPDLKLILQAVDISEQAVAFGKCGRYSLVASQLTECDIFERVRESEIMELFDRVGNVVTVKSWIKEAINWVVGDVTESDTLESVGLQDIVIANNFLCHMHPVMAGKCLRNVARLVSPYGYLFVSGIDLDVRTKVARDLRLQRVQELLEEIHEGDPCMKTYWPWHYAGLEPLNKEREDWTLRYAAAFQVIPQDEKASVGRSTA
jgi:chemotaxis methyl-accepting protein methylase